MASIFPSALPGVAVGIVAVDLPVIPILIVVLVLLIGLFVVLFLLRALLFVVFVVLLFLPTSALRFNYFRAL